jgi:signal transduction protein with GAF and PtsI domain
MTEEEQKAAAAAAAEAEAKAKADADTKAAAEAEAAKGKETIGKVLDTEEKPAPKMVPEAALLDMKKDNKELRKELKELRTSIEEGATKAEVSEDIAAIGEKYGVDKTFLNELAATIRKEVGADTAAAIKPLTANERANRIEKVFSEHFDKAMAEMPEFAGVVNRSVIKSLSLDPENANKTFAQLIDETYGKAIPAGKRTLETTTPRGGKSPDPIDYDRAKSDQKYFAEIMSDPDRKKEYNQTLVDRIGGQL